MYDTDREKRPQQPFPRRAVTLNHRSKRFLTPFLAPFLACALALGGGVSWGWAQDFQSPSLIYKLSGANEKLELTTNTSRILTLDKNIPRVQVNNPDLLAVTPLSANQVQISAKKAGVTQINLWDEDGQIHTVDVLIYGDVKELEVALLTQFPHSSIKVYRYSESLVLKGFVDQPENIGPVIRLAEDYAPKVINNITVGGVQQVLLKVKVMEISRTKLRRLGVDWSFDGSRGGFALNSISEILSFDDAGDIVTTNGDTFSFGIVNGSERFLGFLDALQRNQVAKILAEPNIVAVSGRPAKFISGGEFVYLIPQGGTGQTFTAEFKEFGTIIDFVPIVLGNGNIRLEVRPEVSTRDFNLGSTIAGEAVPGLRKRYVETAVEMKSGQTFALAGLVEERVDTVNRGLPYVSDIPIIGVPFRKTEDEVNEIELLILVTPEFVDPIEPHEAPCGGPGWATVSPNNSDLFCAGHVEVPAHCNPIRGMQACGYDCGGAGCGHAGGYGPVENVITDGVTLPGGRGYDESYAPHSIMRMPNTNGFEPDVMTLPPAPPEAELLPLGPSTRQMPTPNDRRQAARPSGAPQYTVPRPYSPQRQPVYMRNMSRPDNPQTPSDRDASLGGQAGLIGPIGYDAQ